MDGSLLRCLSFILSLGIIISGSSAEVITRTQRYNNPEGQELYAFSEATTPTMHDTYPTIIGSPTDDVPTLDPSPTTPTTTPSTTPMTGPPTMPTTTPSTTPMTGPPTMPTTGPPTTPMTGPPTMPTTGPPTTPTTTPLMPPFGGGGGGGGGSWCVASSSASEKALQVGLDYACGYGGADCSQIQPGATCFNPDTIRDHASFAYNSYYQKNPAPTSCDFGGTAQLVSSDPSSGSCHFPSKGSASPTPPIQTPTMQTPPAMLSPPSPPSTLMPGTPLGGATTFGPEPTASPNMATTTSQQLLLFLSSTCILMYILLANPV